VRQVGFRDLGVGLRAELRGWVQGAEQREGAGLRGAARAWVGQGRSPVRVVALLEGTSRVCCVRGSGRPRVLV